MGTDYTMLVSGHTSKIWQDAMAVNVLGVLLKRRFGMTPFAHMIYENDHDASQAFWFTDYIKDLDRQHVIEKLELLQARYHLSDHFFVMIGCNGDPMKMLWRSIPQEIEALL